MISHCKRILRSGADKETSAYESMFGGNNGKR